MPDPFPEPAARLYLVDDSDDELALAESFLRRAGAWQEVRAFTDGDVAQEEFARLTHAEIAATAAIFIDVKMPGLSGLELLEWIRSRREYDTVPVIISTSSDHPRDIARAAQAGAQCYLTKFPKVDALAELLALLPRSYEASTAPEFPLACNLLPVGKPTG